MKPPIGLYGGTFDPPHWGHFRLALAVKAHCDLAEVAFIPCQQPVHKASTKASASQRLAMLEIECQAHPGLRVDECEIKRDSPSYTIQTLKDKRTLHPETPLCLLLGYDAFLSLPSWRDWQHLLSYAHLIIVHRPGHAFELTQPLERWYQRHRVEEVEALHQTLAGGCYRFDALSMDIDSSTIRARLAAGKSAEGLVPLPILNYIKTNKIY